MVVGGGATGTLAAHALVDAGAAPGGVTVVDDSPRPGPGLAYGAAAPHHLLNNVAGRMSVHPGDPDHFVDWAHAHDVRLGRHDFAPRRLYGDYLAACLDWLVRGPAGVRHVRARAVDVEPRGDAAAVRLRDGRALDADAVVLALGTPPPVVPAAVADHPALVADPWRAGAFDALPDGARVGLLGTGLTMVDVAITLARRDPAVRLVATSRHGLLPAAHAGTHAGHGPGVGAHPRPLRVLLADVRRQVRAAEAAGLDWRTVVDGVRPAVGDLWAGLDDADRERFVRHVARRWEVRRHRMAPQVAAEVGSLCRRGTLEVTTGPPDGVDALVLCTGPRSVGAAGWSPLVDALRGRGLVRPDRLCLGLDLDGCGRARASDGRPVPWLHALGQARRGERWESAAVPEIRLHAHELADRMAGDAAVRRRIQVGAGDGNRTRTVSLGS